MSDQVKNMISPRKHQEQTLLVLVALRALSLLLIAAGLYFGWVFYGQRQNFKPLLTPPGFRQEDRLPQPPTRPQSLQIPSLHISAAVVPLGLTPKGELQVPSRENEVGWYENGAKLGEKGPLVMVGHYDSAAGPAIFYHLSHVKAGDIIEVTGGDGAKTPFTVTSLEEYRQDQFPTEKVYGQTGLRLITCSGTYNRAEQRYSHNLIIFAEKMP